MTDVTATVSTVQRHAILCDFLFTIVTATVMHYCDATAARNKLVHLSARLQPITMPESVWAWSTSCGIIVYCHFCVFRLINKGSYAVKRQLTICCKSPKPIQIGLCMLMSLSIHLHGLHLDTQCGQTWHLSTQLCSAERTGHRLLWSTTLLLQTLLSDSHVSISLVIHGLWWTVSGHVLHKLGLTQSPSCDCGQWQTIFLCFYVFIV